MSCALRKNKGSGYVKETGKDTLSPALEALKASRDAQIAALYPRLGDVVRFNGSTIVHVEPIQNKTHIMQ